MSERPLRQDGNLTVAFAAWMVLMNARGSAPTSDELASVVAAVRDQASADALLHLLGDRIEGTRPEDVQALATALYGDRVRVDLGEGDRGERTRRIRRFQFEHSAPWLARIYERHQDVVQPTWIVVESVTDEVLALDPDPFDGLDEERRIPIADFMVLWELDGCSSIALVS